jgi:hypothetical protein
MSRAMLIVCVAAACYAICNVALSIAVASVWRQSSHWWRGDVAAVRARRLLWLRATPAGVAAFVTGAIVLPSFVILEPRGGSEAVGPLLIAFALAGAVQLAVALTAAIVTILRTHAVVRSWLRSGSDLVVNPPAGVPAFAIDSLTPIVALVGVFSPKLVAARRVIDACSRQELNAIVAHERGHLASRDNLKRWLLNCAPDALRCTPIHHEIVGAWHDAAEDAADDVASGGDVRARTELAALLVKIARLATEPVQAGAAVSPFVEPDGLERRVHRLIAETAHLPSGTQGVRSGLLGVLVLTTIASATAATPGALKTIYDAVETLVAFGR